MGNKRNKVLRRICTRKRRNQRKKNTASDWAKRRAQNSNAETPTECTHSQENYVDSGLKDNQSDAPLVEISYMPPMEMSNNHLREYFAGYLTEAETPAETNRNIEEFLKTVVESPYSPILRPYVGKMIDR